MDWEKIYGDLRKRNWIILLVLSSSSYFFMSHSLTTGVILGGFIIIANFKVFQHTIRGAFSPEGIMRTTKMSIIAKYYFRLLALGVIIYYLMSNGWVDPVGMAIGLSTVVISIISLGISRAWRTFTREAA